jgi:CHAD domain-containing protein
MNSGRTPHNPLAIALADAEPQLPFQAWRSLLEECRRRPSRKRVHGLRVATLRLQAQLDLLLGSGSADLPAAQAARQWNKHAGKLRDSLSAVRELDVYRAKLSGLRDTLAVPSNYTPRSSSLCLQQIGELDDLFARKRKIAARELIAGLQHRHRKLENPSTELESAQALGNSLIPSTSPSGLVKMFSDALAEFPKLDVDCLHDFRKRIKSVRYLAELFAESDPRAARFAEALKTMQGVIGEWHDWQELAELATRGLRKRHRDGPMIRLLEALADESLQKALESCRSKIAGLLDESANDESRLQLVPRKPPARNPENPVHLDLRRLA